MGATQRLRTQQAGKKKKRESFKAIKAETESIRAQRIKDSKRKRFLVHRPPDKQKEYLEKYGKPQPAKSRKKK